MVTAAAVLALASCGGGGGGGDDTTGTSAGPTASFADSLEGPERDPALAAQEYVDARNGGDGGTICGLTSFDDQALAGCRKQVAALGPLKPPLEYKLKSVQVIDATHAKVILIQTKPKEPKPPAATQFTMQKVGGDWKVLTVGFAAS